MKYLQSQIPLESNSLAAECKVQTPKLFLALKFDFSENHDDRNNWRWLENSDSGFGFLKDGFDKK